jgi:hypothetical protein
MSATVFAPARGLGCAGNPSRAVRHPQLRVSVQAWKTAATRDDELKARKGRTGGAVRPATTLDDGNQVLLGFGPEQMLNTMVSQQRGIQ